MCCCMIVVIFFALQLAEEDAFDSEKDAASVAYNAAVKGAAKVGFVCRKHASQAVCAPGTSIRVPVSLVCVCVYMGNASVLLAPLGFSQPLCPALSPPG